MRGTIGRETSPRRGAVLITIAAAGIAACVAAVMMTLAGSDSAYPALDAQMRAATIAAPIGIGLYVWHRAPWTKFAQLLVAAGFAWGLTTFAQSGSEVLYSVGRISGWFVEPLLIFLVLAFPSGRLTTSAGRMLVTASLLLVAVLYLPTALLVDSYPTPSPVTSCEGAGCPGNAFMLLGSEPGVVGDAIIPLRETLTILLFAGVTAALAARIRQGTHLMRITLVPVLAVAIVHVAALMAAIIARRVAPDAAVTDVLITATTLSYGGVAVGFLIGLSAWRMFENRALRRVAAGLASHPPALTLAETSQLLSETMDPSLEMVHRPPGTAGVWLDVHGRPATLASVNGTRSVTEVAGNDGHRVVVAHDPALKDTPTFLAVTRSSVLQALENERLGDELRDSLRELRASRARIMSSADRERQRIERNLHDGAQQTLVALRIRLELVSQLLAKNPVRAEQLLHKLAAEADMALDEVRALARGVYPSLLADRGLGDALRAAALRNPVSTRVHVDGVGRYASEIEAATYFCCLEAMQNAMKHAAGVTSISVSMAVEDDLHFEVSDDGEGFDEAAAVSGAGLTGMRDRLAAIGGVLAVSTAPGMGTRVSGTVPLAMNGPVQSGRGQAALRHDPS